MIELLMKYCCSFIVIVFWDFRWILPKIRWSVGDVMKSPACKVKGTF